MLTASEADLEQSKGREQQLEDQMATMQEELDSLRTDNHGLAEQLAVTTLQANKA